MGLELGNYISDLNSAWPLGTDKRRQGDDHLRLIKLVLKNTFPNLNGPVTLTPAQLNGVPDNLGLILTEIISHLEQPGTVKMWHLAHAAVPSGWSICDGSTVPGYGAVPDMRNRFVVGAGSDYTADTVGGADSKTSTSGGGHTPTIQGTALTAAQIPAHDHRLYTWETGSSSDANNFGTVFAKGIAGNTAGTFGYRSATDASAGNNKLVENTGGAAATHTHTADAVAAHTHDVDVRPRYYVTVFICKTSGYTAP